jgi:hypothetical protein
MPSIGPSDSQYSSQISQYSIDIFFVYFFCIYLNSDKAMNDACLSLSFLNHDLEILVHLCAQHETISLNK